MGTQQPCVMMVDDEPMNLEVLQSLLEDAGYQNFIAISDPTKVVDIITERKPDVVLLDLVMPGMSGFEILDHMRARDAITYTPVIVLTAATSAETKLKALEKGATDFLSKPVDASELTLRLKNTLAAKAYQNRLAFYDPLTGLPNRRLFMDRLQWSLRMARRDRTAGAVLQVNVDRFRQVNDALGLSTGDQLLVEVADRVERCVRTTDAVALGAGGDGMQRLVSRLGGDEFNILLTGLTNGEQATVVAQRILDAMAEPIPIAGHDLFVTASIGIAVFPDDGFNEDLLLKNAGVAMGHAKKQGGNAFEFYSRDLNAKSLHRLSLEGALRHAIERNELLMHYQPKVDVATRRLTGAEALVRWMHPERGMVRPDEFIPVAEETGLIVPLGEWVLRDVCKQIRSWHANSLWVPRIAVNVSGNQFRSQNFHATVMDILREARLDPRMLTLELTETTVMANPKDSINMLQALKESGLKLSIDDFGTGYSSLAYLKRLPLDELKVDRSFVNEAQNDNDSSAIITAIISMAHALGLKVVAEGVETRSQLAFLAARGCDQCQGYLFSKPIPAEDFGAILARTAARTGVSGRAAA